MTNTETPQESGGSALTRFLAPEPGLTLEQHGIQANVHSVHSGKVFWGKYSMGKDLPLSLHQSPLAEWKSLMQKALNGGASIYCWLGDSPEFLGPVGR